MKDLITEARELCEKATPGPWGTNVLYVCAGVNDGTHKGWNPPPSILKGECAYCREAGSFVREYKDEKGQTQHIHRFTSDDWRTICNTAGDKIVGNYDYECGGICTSEADAMFIARSRTLIPELCDALEKEQGVMCYYRTDDGKCRKFTDDKYTSYCVGGPCPDEIPTNADRIRGMSDEELADWIDSMLNEDRDDWCPIGCYNCINFKTHHSDPNNKGTHLYACDGCDHEGSHENGLKCGVLKWLTQPAKEERHETD